MLRTGPDQPFLFVLVLFVLSGCAEKKPQVTEQTRATYGLYCAACHEVGAANAPRRGDPKAWAKRLGKGRDAVVRNVVAGPVAMPPRGGCASCSDETLGLLVDYLAE